MGRCDFNVEAGDVGVTLHVWGPGADPLAGDTTSTTSSRSRQVRLTAEGEVWAKSEASLNRLGRRRVAA